MASKKTDSGEAEVQEKVDAETEQGFRGVRVDPTPLENYTLEGVIAGKPTPETDENLVGTRKSQADVTDS